MRFRTFVIDEIKKVDELDEGYTVRSHSFNNVPSTHLSKQKLTQPIKKKINKVIGQVLKPTYFSSIPLDKVFSATEKFGVIVLQEDQTEWSGLLLGGTDKTEQVYFQLGWKDTMDSEKRYQVIPNAMLALSYYKMQSGKYEVLAYIT